jgi:hypothetical protein
MVLDKPVDAAKHRPQLAGPTAWTLAMLRAGLASADVPCLGMSLLDECIQSLAQDVRFEYVHGLISMEQDVNSFIKSAGHDNESRIAALDELAGMVKSQGWREQFEELVLDYIAQQRNHLATD